MPDVRHNSQHRSCTGHYVHFLFPYRDHGDDEIYRERDSPCPVLLDLVTATNRLRPISIAAGARAQSRWYVVVRVGRQAFFVVTSEEALRFRNELCIAHRLLRRSHGVIYLTQGKLLDCSTLRTCVPGDASC